MSTRFCLVTLLGLTVLAAQGAHAQVAAPDSEALQLAKELLRAQKTEQTMLRGFDDEFQAQLRRNSRLPAVFFDSATAVARRRASELVDSIAPLIATSYSKADIRALILFFDSPLGQRFADAQGAIASAARNVAHRWGVRIGAEVIKILADAGIDLSQ